MADARFTQQMMLADFDRLFPNEEACWTYLMMRRWPDGPRCARCGNTKVYESTARPWHWQCLNCGPKPRSPYRYSLKTGTIFEETKKPLLTWFRVLHLMLTSKKGISAAQIHRLIGSGSYETAWYMCMRLRGAMHDPDFQQLMGIVEIDETHIGGKQENRHWKVRQRYSGRGAAHTGKTTVIGAISRRVLFSMLTQMQQPIVQQQRSKPHSIQNHLRLLECGLRRITLETRRRISS